MKPNIRICLVLTVFIVLLAGCGNESGSTVVSTMVIEETPDLEATVDAGIAATMAVEDDIQSTVDAAVEATRAIEQTQAVEAFTVEEMSEEEVANTFVEDAAQASTAVEGVAVTTDAYASDGELTSQEIEDLEALYLESYEEIEYLLYLASIYSYYYGDLAGETLELMIALEDDLWVLVEIAEEYSDELLAVAVALENGEEATEEMIYALEDTADEWYALMETWQGDTGSWQTALTDEMLQRASTWMDVDTSEAAQTRIMALVQAREYVTQVRSAFEDGVLSAEEMAAIAQLAVNAINSLENVGGEQLNSFAATITDLTTMMAVGEMPSALESLYAFDESLPNR